MNKSKKLFGIICSLILIAALIVVSVIEYFGFSKTQALISDGAPAVDVLGQSVSGAPVYTSSAANNGGSVGNIGLNSPAGTSVDPDNHRLFVADTSNNRVLVFNLNQFDSLLDYQADFVIGQPDFSTTTPETSSTKLRGPKDVLYWASGYLFVADTDNNRVLVFNVASIGTGDQYKTASYVIGQSNFTSRVAATTRSKLISPSGLEALPFIPGVVPDRLFVSDTGNNRIMVFDITVATLTNGPTALNELGQDNFSKSDAKTYQDRFYTPLGLAVEPETNRLFVADYVNNRVMVFDVATITDGESAINVLGQTNFESSNIGGGPAGLHNPYDVSYDPGFGTQRLFVSDSSNNRAIVFDVTQIQNGENAVSVLGQSNFIDSTPATTQSKLSSATYLQYLLANGQLFVADPSSNRYLIFDGSLNFPPGPSEITSISQKTNGSGAVDVSVAVADHDFADLLQLKIGYAAGSDCSNTTASTLDSTAGTYSSTPSGTLVINNSSVYQITGIPVLAPGAGSTTVEFDWLSASNAPTANGVYCLKTIPFDGALEGPPTSATVTLDNVAPTSAGNLTVASRTQTSITYTLGSAGADTNFSRYRIFYKQGASGVTQSNTELVNTNLQAVNYNGSTTVTVSGLSANTQYTANIWTYDTYGHSSAATEVATTTLPTSQTPAPETPAPPSGGGGGGGGGGGSGGSPAPSTPQQPSVLQPVTDGQAGTKGPIKISFSDLIVSAKLTKKNIEAINKIAQLMANNYNIAQSSKFSPFSVTKRQFAIQTALTIAEKTCGDQVNFSSCSEAAIKAGLLEANKMPKLKITRAEYYKILLKAAGIPLIKKSAIEKDDLCGDVKITDTYAQVVATAKARGIASVYKGNKCNINQPFPRYAAAVFAERALKAMEKAKK